MQAIQNIDLGGSGIGSDQAIFRLLDEELTFNNLVATVTDPRITADDGLLVYYDNPSVATAAGITISWTAGVVTFTAAQAPSSTVVVTIYDIKPALANVWDSIGADEVSYDNADSGLTSTTVQDAIDEVAQGGGWVQVGEQTGTTAVALSGNETEILVKIKAPIAGSYIYFTIALLKAMLTSTAETYRSGSSDGTNKHLVSIAASTSSIAINYVNMNGTVCTNSSVITVYAK